MISTNFCVMCGDLGEGERGATIALCRLGQAALSRGVLSQGGLMRSVGVRHPMQSLGLARVFH